MSIGRYTFSVGLFTIKNTRSRHKDTDFISASVAVAGRPTHKATQKLGDLDNGTFKTAMLFKDVPVADNGTAAFSHAIVNSGHQDPTAVENRSSARSRASPRRARRSPRRRPVARSAPRSVRSPAGSSRPSAGCSSPIATGRSWPPCAGR